jgi:hypothetical protein
MSIAGRSKLRWQVPEFHLDGACAKRGVTELAVGTADVQGHPIRVGRDDPAGNGTSILGSDLDQAPRCAPPVPRFGERAVNAG